MISDAPSEPISWQRRVRRAAAYGGGLAMPVPRTVGFVATKLVRGNRSQLSAGTIAGVALDELILAVMKTPGRYPRRHEYEAIAEEIAAAHDLHVLRGWHENPASYHRPPPPPARIRASRPVALGPRWERIVFESGYEPHDGEPGRDRWLSYAPNRVVHACVLRGDPREPWLVCLHPFGTGMPMVDARSFRAAALHEELGLNVIMPALPLHGPRKIGRMSGTGFMTNSFVDVGYGLAQSVWDVRRLLRLIEAQGGTKVGLYGVSLGAHVSALVAGLEDDLACVIAGVPTVNLVEVFGRHIPRRLQGRAAEHRMIGTEATLIHRVVSPLTFAPRVPLEGRFIFAGAGDRMSTPRQAKALWRHWDEPRMEWFRGNHVEFLWSAGVTAFVRDALRSRLAA